MSCSRFQFGDATGYVCTRTGGRRAKCCACGQPATLQCDAVLRGAAVRGKKHLRTCDKYICSKCAVRIGPDADLCPIHAEQTRNGPGPRVVSGGEQQELPLGNSEVKRG